MSDDASVEDFEKYLKEFEVKLAGHMEAIEAMKKGTALNAFYYDRGWNAAIEAAANLVQDEMGDPDDTFWIVEKVRKLKK